jgi:type IX secretion system PorP/SprF family membrane protein
VLAVVCLAANLFAQDVHHSQFYTSPLNVNPGLTGIFNGDYRAAVNLRSQWAVNDLVNYQTVSFNGDMKIQPRNPESKGFWSAGLLFNYDQAGDSRLNLAHLGLAGSYTYAVDTGHLLTLGGIIGAAQRRFRTEDLLWDNNWTGNGVDPNLNPMEDFSNTSNNFLDLSAGINYRWQRSARTFLNVGVGVFHLNRPDQTFFNQSSSEVLDIRSTYSLFGSIQLLQSLDLLLHGIYIAQGTYDQTLVGGYGRIHINQQRGKEFALLVGLSGRIDDAWIPKIAVELRNWYVGFSYDINVSEFDLVTQNRGGPELSVIYRMTTVKPLPKFKNCPIF